MATNFAIQPAQKYDESEVRLFPVASGQTFVVGALVVYDTTNNNITECGADPALILGIALAPASVGLATGGSIFGGTNIPVLVLDPATVCWMASATTPAQSHVMDDYGIAKSTNWLVDTTETVATCVKIVGISNSPYPEGFFVKFLAANLQGDAVAS